MRNDQREFDAKTIRELGTYVYGLRDPRDRKIFYVGKGTENRVFDHFSQGDEAAIGKREWTSKLRRIAEIWGEEMDVEWFIIRRNIQELLADANADTFAEEIEASIMDALAESQNGPLVNDASGKRSSIRGILGPKDVRALGAMPVDPESPYPVVFVFPVQNALAESRDIYDATRRLWTHSAYMEGGVFAIGLASGISEGVFRVTSWHPDGESGKMFFEGEKLSSHELNNKNWTAILSASRGYWLRGNYLVVEFDGKHQFRVLRGAQDKDAWRELK